MDSLTPDVVDKKPWRPVGILHRIGRRIFWPQPTLYRWVVSKWRGRHIPKARPGLFWVGGYPRSANTFTAYNLKHCLRPAESIEFHLHLPPQILVLHKAGSPGILVLRKPLSAVMSYCQLLHLHQRGASLVEALASKLDYYIDFHRSLRAVAPQLFIASFDDVTRDIQAVLRCFFITNGVPRAVPDLEDSKIFAELEHHWAKSDGSIDEFSVARPSQFRAEQRSEHWHRLHVLSHPDVQRRLREAEKLHTFFHSYRAHP